MPAARHLRWRPTNRRLAQGSCSGSFPRRWVPRTPTEFPECFSLQSKMDRLAKIAAVGGLAWGFLRVVKDVHVQRLATQARKDSATKLAARNIAATKSTSVCEGALNHWPRPSTCRTLC